jgi:hypothetical protein
MLITCNMSRPAKPTACPLCHTVFGREEPVYSIVTTEIYQIRKWTGSDVIETGKTGTRYLGWYACEACARKEQPDFFPTAESLKPLLDKAAVNPHDWMAHWEYERAAEKSYLEHRQCAWCNRPIYEKNGYRFVRWKPMGPVCCSSNCTNARAYARRAERTKRYATPRETTCLTCQKRFSPTRIDARFCSNACRQKHYRENRSVTDDSPLGDPREVNEL